MRRVSVVGDQHRFAALLNLDGVDGSHQNAYGGRFGFFGLQTIQGDVTPALFQRPQSLLLHQSYDLRQRRGPLFEPSQLGHVVERVALGRQVLAAAYHHLLGLHRHLRSADSHRHVEAQPAAAHVSSLAGPRLVQADAEARFAGFLRAHLQCPRLILSVHSQYVGVGRRSLDGESARIGVSEKLDEELVPNVHVDGASAARRHPLPLTRQRHLTGQISDQVLDRVHQALFADQQDVLGVELVRRVQSAAFQQLTRLIAVDSQRDLAQSVYREETARPQTAEGVRRVLVLLFVVVFALVGPQRLLGGENPAAFDVVQRGDDVRS